MRISDWSSDVCSSDLRTGVDASALERERDVLSEQARASGKPEDIIAKMVEGRLRKFYEEVVLLEQTYVIDGETKVSKVLDAARSEEHTSELQSLMSISYAVFCLKKKNRICK